jgi:putative phosphoesterase
LRIALLSDTHIRRGRPRLPPRVIDALRGSDLVLHAGDILDETGLRMIEAAGVEVVAVAGNLDRRTLVARLPAERRVETPAGTIALVHALPRAGGGAAESVERMLGDCAQPLAVVHGHTHRPRADAVQLDGGRTAWVVNPGSPTQARGHGLSFAMMTIDGEGQGRARVEIVALD